MNIIQHAKRFDLRFFEYVIGCVTARYLLARKKIKKKHKLTYILTNLHNKQWNDANLGSKVCWKIQRVIRIIEGEVFK